MTNLRTNAMAENPDFANGPPRPLDVALLLVALLTESSDSGTWRNRLTGYCKKSSVSGVRGRGMARPAPRSVPSVESSSGWV